MTLPPEPPADAPRNFPPSHLTPADGAAATIGVDDRAGRGRVSEAGARKGRILAWGLWDWGSAAVQRGRHDVRVHGLPDERVVRATGTVEAQLGWALAIAGLLIAVLAPITGQRSDTSGRRKLWLAVNTYIVVAITLAMFFVLPAPEYLLLGLFLVAAGNVFFEFAGVNYNAMLVQVSTPRSIGKVSGFGWGMGYVGGIVLLLIVYFGFIQPEVGLFGVTGEGGLDVRVTMVVAAIWFGVFALPVLLRGARVPQSRRRRSRQGRLLRVVRPARPRHRPALARAARHGLVPARERGVPRRPRGGVHVRRRARGIRVRVLGRRGHHLRDRRERRGGRLDHRGRRARRPARGEARDHHGPHRARDQRPHHLLPARRRAAGVLDRGPRALPVRRAPRSRRAARSSRGSSPRAARARCSGSTPRRDGR